MNLIYLIRLSGLSLVGAGYFLLTTAVQAQIISETSNFQSSEVVNKQRYSISAKDLLAQ